jgi:hypothetical protein
MPFLGKQIEIRHELLGTENFFEIKMSPLCINKAEGKFIG